MNVLVSDTIRLTNVFSAYLRCLFAIACLFLTLTSQNLYAQSSTFDWSDLGIPSLNSVDNDTSLTEGARTVTITHQEISDGGAFGPGFDDSILLSFAGTIGSQTGPLVYSMANDSFDPDDRFESIFSFNGPIENLNFTVSHVDLLASTPRSDGVIIEYDTGTGVFQNLRDLPTAFTIGSSVGFGTFLGVEGFQGVAAAPTLASTLGDISVDFGTTQVERVRITYHFGTGATGAPSGGTQFIGLSDFDFDIPLPPNFADLELNKTASNPTPANGTAVDYTLTLTSNAASTDTVNNVIVTDILPLGVIFNSATGFGSYNSSNGEWTIPSIAPGQSRIITINVTVDVTAGATITNDAEVVFSPLVDIDSVAGDGIGDDFSSASFTVQGTRTAGTPPPFTCPAGSTNFEWDPVTWPAGSTNNDIAVANIGDVNVDISTDGLLDGGTPLVDSSNTGGFGAGTLSLFQFLEFSNRDQTATTVFTLPTAVPGIRFTILDVDFLADDFADKVTVIGSFNGTTVIPILTNGVANFVVGNTAIGDAGSDGASADGNVIVTFNSPVDTITFIYGNHTTAPDDPDGQAASLLFMTLCNPEANLSITKISNVLNDPISSSNPKAIPGATIRYCITVSNLGSGTTTNISAVDPLPANVTYVPGSLLSGASCASATNVEDDDAVGADENDPFGISFASNIVTGIAANLAPTESFAIVFTATVD